MSSKLPMLDVYDKILTTCGYQVDDNGQVRKQNIKSLPVSMQFDQETRYLVLPTKENLKSERASEYVFFHPFQENLVRGEPRVLAMIRKELNRTYGSAVAALMIGIVDISAGGLNHTDLSPEQRNFIGAIGKVDERFNKDFNRIIENLAKRNGKDTPLNLSLRKGVEWAGHKYSRLAVWSSPLYEEVLDTIEQVAKNKDYSPKILGVPVRKQDLKTYENLCKLFFGDIAEKNHSEYGASDATDAPYAEAFVRSLKTLPVKINQIAETFFGGDMHVYASEVAKDNLNLTRLNVDWLLDLESELGKEFTVATWRKEYLLIPIQEGNEGVSPVNEKATRQESAEEEKPKAAETSRWGAVTEPLKGNASDDEPPFTPSNRTETRRRQDRDEEEQTNPFLRNAHSSRSRTDDHRSSRDSRSWRDDRHRDDRYREERRTGWATARSSGFSRHRDDNAYTGYQPGDSDSLRTNTRSGFGSGFGSRAGSRPSSFFSSRENNTSQFFNHRR